MAIFCPAVPENVYRWAKLKFRCGAAQSLLFSEPVLVSPMTTGVMEQSLAVNSALTAVSALTITVHDPLPVHPPLHPALKVEPVAGFAFKVTLVPGVKKPEHPVPQLIAVGLLVIVPNPEPLLLIVSEKTVESVSE